MSTNSDALYCNLSINSTQNILSKGHSKDNQSADTPNELINPSDEVRTPEDVLIEQFNMCCMEMTKDIDKLNLFPIDIYPCSEYFGATLKHGIKKTKKIIEDAYAAFQTSTSLETTDKIANIALVKMPEALEKFKQDFYCAVNNRHEPEFVKAIRSILGLQVEGIVFALFFGKEEYLKDHYQELAKFKEFINETKGGLQAFVNAQRLSSSFNLSPHLDIEENQLLSKLRKMPYKHQTGQPFMTEMGSHTFLIKIDDKFYFERLEQRVPLEYAIANNFISSELVFELKKLFNEDNAVQQKRIAIEPHADMIQFRKKWLKKDDIRLRFSNVNIVQISKKFGENLQARMQNAILLLESAFFEYVRSVSEYGVVEDYKNQLLNEIEVLTKEYMDAMHMDDTSIDDEAHEEALFVVMHKVVKLQKNVLEFAKYFITKNQYHSAEENFELDLKINEFDREIKNMLQTLKLLDVVPIKVEKKYQTEKKEMVETNGLVIREITNGELNQADQLAHFYAKRMQFLTAQFYACQRQSDKRNLAHSSKDVVRLKSLPTLPMIEEVDEGRLTPCTLSPRDSG